MRLNVKALALAGGIIWGGYLFVLTWWLIVLDGATGEPTFIARVYRGYSISPTGSVVGLAWGLADGAIVGALIAWLYNAIAGWTSTDRSEDGDGERP
jgi:hypothetical protein